jgi:hypothetical protein
VILCSVASRSSPPRRGLFRLRRVPGGSADCTVTILSPRWGCSYLSARARQVRRCGSHDPQPLDGAAHTFASPQLPSWRGSSRSSAPGEAVRSNGVELAARCHCHPQTSRSSAPEGAVHVRYLVAYCALLIPSSSGEPSSPLCPGHVSDPRDQVTILSPQEGAAHTPTAPFLCVPPRRCHDPQPLEEAAHTPTSVAGLVLFSQAGHDPQPLGGAVHTRRGGEARGLGSYASRSSGPGRAGPTRSRNVLTVPTEGPDPQPLEGAVNTTSQPVRR